MMREQTLHVGVVPQSERTDCNSRSYLQNPENFDTTNWMDAHYL